MERWRWRWVRCKRWTTEAQAHCLVELCSCILQMIRRDHHQMPMLIYSCCFSSSMNSVTGEKPTLLSSSSHFYRNNVTQLCLQWSKFALAKPYEFPSPGPFSALDDHLFSVPTSTTSTWVLALIVTKQILSSANRSQLSKVRGTRSCKWTGITVQ